MISPRQFLAFVLVAFVVISTRGLAATGVIEKQLADIGSISDDEIIVVQRQFTNKRWRHELTPISIGGIPFGTVRRTLVGGASYTLHTNDWLGFEVLNFAFTKTFFSSFSDDINANKNASTGGLNSAQADIRPDYQKLLYFLTSGIQITPFYGKVSTFSRWIAYVEPYIGFGAGLAKTESNSYLAFYPAVGLRVFFKEWLSMRVEFRDYIYSEKFVTRTVPETTDSALRNNYAMTVSFSFWLPKMPG
jgi:outer membrane beta-barrel protein